VDRELAKRVVDCLRLTGDIPKVDRLRQCSERDWRRTLLWLDRAGLTLYLLRRLQSLKATDVLPPSILRRLENNLAQNRRRLDHMVNQFATINERFYRAGVNFAVIKGFSLAPEFCPDVSLRNPCDLDYLVDRQSLPLARRVLEEAGYCRQRVSDIEVQFRKLSSRIPTRSDDSYSVETEPLVELHLGFWDQKSTGVALAEPQFRLNDTVNHEWQGLRFPVLKKEDAFILQIMHVFEHVLAGWVKLCWLLEIGYFMTAQSSDDMFWDRVDVRMHEVPLLDEFGAIVMELAGTLFAPTKPPRVVCWARSLSAAAGFWVELYGRTWVMEDHPFDVGLFASTKLCIFLQWEFMPDRLVQREVTRRRLFPWKSPEQAAPRDHKTTVGFLRAIGLQSQFVIRRLIFHLGSDLRFLWELRRWRELNRRAKVNPPGAPQRSVSPGRFN
jgi:Uncharacterised nucleotidyltransferase